MGLFIATLNKGNAIGNSHLILQSYYMAKNLVIGYTESYISTLYIILLASEQFKLHDLTLKTDE